MQKKQKQGMTRRQFAAGTAAAGFAILSSRAGVAQTNGETLKIGLIGCGNRGAGAATDCLVGNENVKLVAMADLLEEKLNASRQKLMNNGEINAKVDVSPDMQFVGVDAYQKLLDTDVDMIIHGTTPYIRPKHLMAAVNAGKHIFTEKPIAVDAPGIRMAIDAAQKATDKKLCIVTGTQRRHQKPYVETIQKIQDGAIGEVLSARAYWCGTLPFAFEREEGWSDLEYRIRNWYAYCWVCGDNIVEQHVHNLDVINWVMGGPPAKVFASGGRAWKPRTEMYGDLWDHFSCDYEYANGVHMMSMSRHLNNSHNEVSEAVVGTKGRSNCHDMGEEGINPYVQEHIDLVKAIRGEADYINELKRTSESTLTAIMGRMAGYTGKQVTYEEALNSEESIVPEVLDFEKKYPVGPIPRPGMDEGWEVETG